MRLIDADALIDDLMERYCKECDKRKGIKNGKYRIIYEIGEAPCKACEVDDIKAELEKAPFADMVKAITEYCKPRNLIIIAEEDFHKMTDVAYRKIGEWDMFDLISSAYYGKTMYFMQGKDDIVYSRFSDKYMKVDDALREFISLIDDSELPSAERKVGKWIWEDSEKRWGWACSNCGYGIRGDRGKTNYCPSCGAEMSKGEDDE